MNKHIGERPCRVLVVDGDPAARTEVSSQLHRRGYSVIGPYASGKAMLAARRHAADVALVELDLSGMSCAELIAQLRKRSPTLPILVQTARKPPDAIVDLLMSAIAAGGDGFVLKQPGEVISAIEQVRAGESPIAPALARHLFARLRRTTLDAPTDFRLTTRERQVLALLVRGHSYAEVADSLALRLGTLQTYVKSIYRKLRVRSKTEAALVAVRHRLVSTR